MFLFLRNILQLLLAPSRGWEDVSAQTESPETLERHCLFPMMAVASLSVFFQLVYHSDLSFITLFEKAIVVFASYFTGFFFAKVMYMTFARYFTDGEPNERKATRVFIYVFAILSICAVIGNLLPVDIGLSVILPLAVLLVFWKASLYLCVPADKELVFLLFGFGCVITPPVLVQMLFSIFI